jgi:membrane AbrB-like protein
MMGDHHARHGNAEEKDTSMRLPLLLAAAAAVGLLLQRFDMPGGLVVGAMIGAAAFNLAAGGQVDVPPPLRTASFIVLGAVIGSGITRETLMSLQASVLPAVIAAMLIIVAGVGVTLALRALGIAPPGDVLATSPGALSAITAVAAERGVGAPEVALFHTIRVVLVLVSLPLILTILPGD